MFLSLSLKIIFPHLHFCATLTQAILKSQQDFQHGFSCVSADDDEISFDPDDIISNIEMVSRTFVFQAKRGDLLKFTDSDGFVMPSVCLLFLSSSLTLAHRGL